LKESRQPSPARQLAFEVLHRVESEGAYATVLLDHYQPRLPDARDAALLRELVLGVLRQRSAVDHVLSLASTRPLDRVDAPVRLALRVGAYEILFLERIPDFASVDSCVELIKRAGHHAAAGFTNAVLRKVARLGRLRLPADPDEGDVAGLALRHSHPEWWVERVVARVGWQAAEALLAADNRAVPTVLRAAGGADDVEPLRRELAAEGVETETVEHVPEALRVRGGVAQRTDAFRRGRFWIQGEASQLVPRLFGPALQSASRIADVCAAPGGKTLILATTATGGHVVACDLHDGRLRRLRGNLERVGVRNVSLVAGDMAADPPPLRGSFDAVLVDAPCSGTGTLRRHPEIRWRLEPGDIERLAKLQRRILARAADLVAPGGSLVYAVCSLEPEEGSEQIAAFREARPDFRPSDPRRGLPGPAASLVDERGFFSTSPAAGGMDGFFGALMTRSPLA
jgi:16S rRNA (cytosine967-C5)-methyltransferase